MNRPRPPIDLPNRRPGVTLRFPWRGHELDLCIGFDPRTFNPVNGRARPAEVFCRGYKIGSDADEHLDNDMIALSKLLQAGADPAELAHTFGPDTLLGAVSRAIAREELTT